MLWPRGVCVAGGGPGVFLSLLLLCSRLWPESSTHLSFHAELLVTLSLRGVFKVWKS